jgi:hypothetical protein
METVSTQARSQKCPVFRLKAHVLAFVTAYNFAKHLKARRWRTPYQVICKAWTKDPSIFKINPHKLIPGPHIQSIARAVAPQ